MCYIDLVEQVEMDPSLDKQEACVVPSRNTGTTDIDHIDTYGIPKENVVCAGQIPHGIGFDSDHRCIYADLDIKSILGLMQINMNRRLDAE